MISNIPIYLEWPESRRRSGSCITLTNFDSYMGGFVRVIVLYMVDALVCTRLQSLRYVLVPTCAAVFKICGVKCISGWREFYILKTPF